MTLSGAGRRRKGHVWASQAAAMLQARVDPAVCLTAPGVAKDRGDAAGLPCVVEFKNCREIELGEWSTQAEKAAITARLYRWLLVVKRRGKPRPEDGWMVVPAWFGCELLAAWLPTATRAASQEPEDAA